MTCARATRSPHPDPAVRGRPAPLPDPADRSRSVRSRGSIRRLDLPVLRSDPSLNPAARPYADRPRSDPRSPARGCPRIPLVANSSSAAASNRRRERSAYCCRSPGSGARRGRVGTRAPAARSWCGPVGASGWPAHRQGTVPITVFRPDTPGREPVGWGRCCRLVWWRSVAPAIGLRPPDVVLRRELSADLGVRRVFVDLVAPVLARFVN